MGVGRVSVSGKYRRIDILTIPFENWGAALIYFTGNEVVSQLQMPNGTDTSSTAAFDSTPARRGTR